MKYKSTGKSKVMGFKGKLINVEDEVSASILLKKGFIEEIKEISEEVIEAPIHKDVLDAPVVKKRTGNPNWGKK